MTSKEALEKLFGSYVSSKCYGINYKKDDEYYNIIKQDLEVLEIIKKYFEIEVIDILGTETITIKEKRKPFNIIAHLVTSNDIKLLKEVLNNE